MNNLSTKISHTRPAKGDAKLAPPNRAAQRSAIEFTGETSVTRDTDRLRAFHRQQGVVLIVSLVLLLVITLLGLAASQSTSLEERMAGYQRQHQLAFEAAEAALRAGESALNGSASLPPFDGSVTGYYPTSTDASGNPLMAGADWKTWNWTKSIAYTNGALSIGGNAQATASYYIEQFKYVPAAGQSLDVSLPIPGQQLYAITARGVSPDGKSAVVLQSTYKR